MSSSYRKIKYKEEGAYGSDEEHYIYAWFHHTTNSVTFYGSRGEYLFSTHQWSNSFDKFDRMIELFKDSDCKDAEYLTNEELEMIEVNRYGKNWKEVDKTKLSKILNDRTE